MKQKVTQSHYAVLLQNLIDSRKYHKTYYAKYIRTTLFVPFTYCHYLFSLTYCLSFAAYIRQHDITENSYVASYDRSDHASE